MRHRAGRPGIVLAITMLAASIAATGPRTAAADPSAGCIADVEPNDDPVADPTPSGPACLAGTLPVGDRDLAPWTLTPEDAGTRWHLRLHGIEDAITGFGLVNITSEPGVEPLVTESAPFVQIQSSVDDRDAELSQDLILRPGRYLLGIYRSAANDAVADPDLSYVASIERADPLPPSGDAEPDDVPGSGPVHEGPFALSGDLAGSVDVYRWSAVDDGVPDARWRLALTAPAGSDAGLTVATPDGSFSRTLAVDATGHVAFPDLGPRDGGYLLTVSPAQEVATPYILEAAETMASGADLEPDDTPPLALPLVAGTGVTGRMATPGDTDLFRFDLDPDSAGHLIDLRLIAPADASEGLCVYGPEYVSPIACRSGSGGVALRGLLLPAGTYLAEVTGAFAPDAPYHLLLDVTSAPAADFEIEPNDRPELADPMAPGVVMRGDASGGDTDVHRLAVTGEPRIWRVEADGQGLAALDWLRKDGTTLVHGAVSSDGTSAVLEDLYLVPGEHRVSLTGSGGRYTITATPLGPPDPDAEREPNDDDTRAGRIAPGDTRTGRVLAGDRDVYRLSVTAMEHLRLWLDTPPDGSLSLRLETGNERFIDTSGITPGTSLMTELALPPGDYSLSVGAQQSSEQRYRLGLERLDPLDLVGDLEPNQLPSAAAPLPASGHVEGTGLGDVDTYRLPPVGPSGRLAFRISGPVSMVTVSDGTTDLPLVADEDGIGWHMDGAPVGPLYLGLYATGSYTIDLVDPTPAPAAGPVTVVLEGPGTTVAGWWPEGQHLSMTAVLGNPSDAARSVTLIPWTSAPGWTIQPPEGPVEVPARGTVRVPLTLAIPAEAPAGVPVAVAIGARDGTSTGVDAMFLVAPDRDADPVAPGPVPALPDSLLGGLDVAATTIGGTPLDSADPAAEAIVHDGLAVDGAGVDIPLDADGGSIAVDLAGDAPVRVVGTTIDPASGLGLLSSWPRAFALELSDDGTSYETILTGELSPLGVEQAFPLDAPVDARAARLVIRSTWGGSLFGHQASAATISEWKVIAEPGVDPAGGPRDIADLALGGHIVYMDPTPGIDPAAPASMLTENRARTYSYPPGGNPISWVIGFMDDRAARITALEWVDPDGSDPKARFRKVQVEVSTDSPLGPWIPIGAWELDRAADGSVGSMHLADPVWARFVRLTGDGPRKEGTAWELPATIRVFEQPTDDGYRSILGEWGQLSPDGPMEASGAGVAPPPPVDDPDVGDTADDAAPLADAATASGRVHQGEDEDWYVVHVPEGRNSLTVTVAGHPFVGAQASLEDASGTGMPLSIAPGAEPGTMEYRATVNGGADYRIRIGQPASSVVFLYDTSLSIASYWAPITRALDAFASGVVPGRQSALIRPVDGDPLIPTFSDDPFELQTAVEGALSQGNSNVESGLLTATGDLSGRGGARAIVVVTDADTNSYGLTGELWKGLAAVRPMIFPVHVGGAGDPAGTTHRMQDWAAAAGGNYRYAHSQDEMDRAFDELATRLRRPASYTISFVTSDEPVPEPDPGTLHVSTPRRTSPGPEASPEPGAPGASDGGATPALVAQGSAIELILDTSGSMLDRVAGQRKIDSAKAVLTHLVTSELAPGSPVALRWFRQAPRSCDTELAVPLGPLDPDAVSRRIDTVRIDRSVNTPLAAAIDAVTDDLAGIDGKRIVVIVSDGAENCGGDPVKAVKRLRANGIDATVNVVGLGLDAKTRRQIRKLAALGGGTYVDARSADQLSDALRGAVSAPYEVSDASGAVVAHGTVDGDPVSLPPGIYRVRVLTDPEQVFDEVTVRTGRSSELTLRGPGE